MTRRTYQEQDAEQPSEAGYDRRPRAADWIEETFESLRCLPLRSLTHRFTDPAESHSLRERFIL
jgi:hypothetical protein